MKVKIRIRRRKVDKNIKFPFYFHPLLRRIYASRGVRSIEELERSTKNMLSWKKLSNIEKAVDMLYEALEKKLKIVIIGDFDVDGATGIALIALSLQELGFNDINYIVPNRFKDGYGFTPEIVKKAHDIGAKMIITVDNGISSHIGVDLANKLEIPVLITDHHLPSNTLPKARAIVNPNLPDCNFSSKSLAGVGVAFYLIIALRTFLYDKGWFKKNNIIIPNLAKYLDLVALGTVADVVPLDFNNRILIWQGLNRIRSGKCRPGIKALLEIANRDPKKFTTSDLGFVLGPRLNAAGRLNDMSIGVALLLCEDFFQAKILANQLNELNHTRKKIEINMQKQALSFCKTLKSKKKKLPNGLAIYYPDWHQGVVGILASRIKERFYRPVIAFASAGNGFLKGSGRSIKGIHMYNILEQLNILYPNLILTFGGHAMAVGLLIEEKKFEEFQLCFSKLITEQTDPSLLQEEIISDGILTPDEMTIEVAQMLSDAGPWGQMFPEPLFDGHFQLLQQKLIKERHLKVRIKPFKSQSILNGIAFSVDTTYWPNENVQKVELAYKLDINEFRCSKSLQITINSICPI